MKKLAKGEQFFNDVSEMLESGEIFDIALDNIDEIIENHKDDHPKCITITHKIERTREEQEIYEKTKEAFIKGGFKVIE